MSTLPILIRVVGSAARRRGDSLEGLLTAGHMGEAAE